MAEKRIDALFDIERTINGVSAEERLRVRQEQSTPLLAALETWLREEHVGPPGSIGLKTCGVLIVDGRKRCPGYMGGAGPSEPAFSPYAVSAPGKEFPSTAVTTLIATAKLNDIDPLAWLADVLARIADIQQGRLSGLLPWKWKPYSGQRAV